VQQVASGTGTRGISNQGGTSTNDPEFSSDPAEAKAAGEIHPPVNAFPPRGGASS
jgi:hypothetical protein